VRSDESAGVVIVLVVLSLLAIAVRIVKQYENGVPGVWCSDSAGQKAGIRTTR
jgi:Na+-transporting methylmalonyl-CoA/oxaloacetate decarboxylase gamma subunit